MKKGERVRHDFRKCGELDVRIFRAATNILLLQGRTHTHTHGHTKRNVRSRKEYCPPFRNRKNCQWKCSFVAVLCSPHARWSLHFECCVGCMRRANLYSLERLTNTAVLLSRTNFEADCIVQLRLIRRILHIVQYNGASCFSYHGK